LAPTVINKMNRNIIRVLAVILIISYGKVLHAQQNFKEAYFKYDGNIGLQKFLQNKFSAEVKKHQLDICLISATFAEFRIDTTGNIKDLVFFENHDTPQVFREVLMHIISETNGLWIPAQINGKATESRVYILPLIYEMESACMSPAPDGTANSLLGFLDFKDKNGMSISQLDCILLRPLHIFSQK